MQENVTQLLLKAGNGDQDALNRILPLVYKELRTLASRYLRMEYGQRTIQTTELVHEAYLKLFGNENLTWQNKAHFFGIAANSMRQILVDFSRKRKAVKRNRDGTRVSLNEGLIVIEENDDQIISLDEALKKLEEFDPQLSKIVELRYFAGLTLEESAEVLNISVSTLKREWNAAKAWLYRELNEN